MLRAALERTLLAGADVLKQKDGAEEREPGTEVSPHQLVYTNDQLQLVTSWENESIEAVFTIQCSNRRQQKREQRYARQCAAMLGDHLHQCIEEWNEIKQTTAAADESVINSTEAAITLNRQSRNALVILHDAWPWATFGIMAICLLVFISTALLSGSLLQFDTDVLVQIGALYNLYYFGGQYWRIITALFVHGSLLHVAANMFLFFLWGMVVEPYLRTGRMILVFLTTGVLAFAASLLWNHDKFILMYGASSAVMGTLGFMLVLFWKKKSPPLRRYVFSFQMLILVVALLLGGRSKDADILGHTTGFISGMIIGLAFMFIHAQFSTAWQRILAFVGFCMLLLTMTFFVLRNSTQSAVGFSRLYAQSTQQIDALFDESTASADSSFLYQQTIAAQQQAAYTQLLPQLERLTRIEVDTLRHRKAALLLRIATADHVLQQQLLVTDSVTIATYRIHYEAERVRLIEQLLAN
ncbi:MAG TPA: rhomboid family intramembrane serine protease [Lacibacter sp.]|nr:rhomboid family intramembrane serine protease [Lacibacter sp.]